MADEKKDNIAFSKTIATKFGPMEKISIEVNKIGNVIEKDGRTFLEIPKGCKFFNKYEKDGAAPRYFMNFVRNTYASISVDEYEPDANASNSGSSEGGNADDLPF